MKEQFRQQYFEASEKDTPLDSLLKKRDIKSIRPEKWSNCKCKRCGKLLFRAQVGSYVETKCPKCKTLNIFEI